VPLATYDHFADRDQLGDVALERMLAGVSRPASTVAVGSSRVLLVVTSSFRELNSRGSYASVERVQIQIS
jgi:hypothetical protein